MGYALPYHASLLFDQYKIGYGIISLRAKESKRAGIKNDVALTKRSKATGLLGKWWQVMRANYVRAFYLPKHNPSPSAYVSHESRHPSHLKLQTSCECGRDKDIDHVECLFCKSCDEIIKSAQDCQLHESVLNILKPLSCPSCENRFADTFSYDTHVKTVHRLHTTPSDNLNPRLFIVKQLREE